MAGFVVVVVEVVVGGAVGTTYLNSDLNQGRARVLIKSHSALLTQLSLFYLT